MYWQRLRFILRNQLNPQDLSTPERMQAALPDRINYPAHNLKNLSELPIIFYALSVLMIITGHDDATAVGLAWIFVILRSIHSLIHCTINHVNSRFAAYFLSSVVLWWMALRFGLAMV